METFLNDIWDAVRPALLTLITGLAPVLATIVATKVISALKVSKDSELAITLYRTIDNTLKALITTKLRAGAVVLTGIPGGLVSEAIAIVKRDNAAAVDGLGQTDEKLTTKIIAKLPEAQASVAEATAKVQDAGRETTTRPLA